MPARITRESSIKSLRADRLIPDPTKNKKISGKNQGFNGLVFSKPYNRFAQEKSPEPEVVVTTKEPKPINDVTLESVNDTRTVLQRRLMDECGFKIDEQFFGKFKYEVMLQSDEDETCSFNVEEKSASYVFSIADGSANKNNVDMLVKALALNPSYTNKFTAGKPEVILDIMRKLEEEVFKAISKPILTESFKQLLQGTMLEQDYNEFLAEFNKLAGIEQKSEDAQKARTSPRP